MPKVIIAIQNLCCHLHISEDQCPKYKPLISTLLAFKNKEEGRDQESIQSSTTPDPGHHMGK